MSERNLIHISQECDAEVEKIVAAIAQLSNEALDQLLARLEGLRRRCSSRISSAMALHSAGTKLRPHILPANAALFGSSGPSVLIEA